jgi:hypothetical protein
MRLKHRIILSFWSVGIFEDVQRVMPIKCPPTDVSNGITDIRVHVVNYCIEIFGKEELANVDES